MAKLTISPTASATLKQLPPDKTLLMAVWRHLQQLADDPNSHSVPAPTPVPTRPASVRVPSLRLGRESVGLLGTIRDWR